MVLGAGAVSALLGVLYALMEHDLKRLLAYHSVENIGIILIGMGAGMIFHSYGLMTLAALGFIGGLYHTINHATFKGLALSRRWIGAACDGHAQHGEDGWPHQADAVDGAVFPYWSGRHIGAAALKRVRLRMVGLSVPARRLQYSHTRSGGQLCRWLSGCWR